MGKKETHLSMRLEPDDQRRLRRRAEMEHLDTSTWARQVLLRALDALDALDEQKAREEREERRRRSTDRSSSGRPATPRRCELWASFVT